MMFSGCMLLLNSFIVYLSIGKDFLTHIFVVDLIFKVHQLYQLYQFHLLSVGASSFLQDLKVSNETPTRRHERKLQGC